MTHAKAGPNELALRAMREKRRHLAEILSKLPAARQAKIAARTEEELRKLIPYAGAAPIVRGGKGSPNRRKQKRK
jgi:hypothetical protein